MYGEGKGEVGPGLCRVRGAWGGSIYGEVGAGLRNDPK